MTALRYWSLGKVLLIAVGWVVLSIVIVVALTLFQMRAVFSGSGGIGAVSIGLSEVALALLVLPSLVLVATWVVAHRR